MGARQEQYEGIAVITVNVRFGAPDEEEARKRMHDIVEVITTARIPHGQIYRTYAPRHMAGRPTVVERSVEVDSVDLVEDD